MTDEELLHLGLELLFGFSILCMIIYLRYLYEKDDE